MKHPGKTIFYTQEYDYRKILFNADLGQCSYVQERTSIINKYMHSICRLLINYKFLDT